MSEHRATIVWNRQGTEFTYKEYTPAVGFMERNDEKRLAITRVVLRPKITWGSEPPNQDQLDTLHHQAHEHCFIANSVTTKVEVAPPA